MKLGIITDIHSNIIALNEVLKEFEKIKNDKINFEHLAIPYNVDEVIKGIKKIENSIL